MAENKVMRALFRFDGARRNLRWACLPLVLALGGCDLMGILGIETAGQIAEQKEAEGKAIGSGCRHAERSIEECYQNNTKAGKAAVFAGWREMDEYMRENKVAGMPPKAKPVIEEMADGTPVDSHGGRPASGSAASGAVRPTSTGNPALRPIVPAASGNQGGAQRAGSASGGASRASTPPTRS
jgi:hypothetical protein